MAIVKAKTNETNKILSDRIKYLQGLEKDNFDPAEKWEEVKKKEEEIEKLQEEIIEIKGELGAYYQATGQPAPADQGALTPKQIEEKIRVVMPLFPMGANGRQIASAIGDYRITTDTVSDLYWTDGQMVLRKEGVGTNTKYLLANEADAEAIEQSKMAEEAQREALKAKRAEKKK